MINPLFALAVQDMGLSSNILLFGAAFFAVFIVCFGWVTKKPGSSDYGRFQKR